MGAKKQTTMLDINLFRVEKGGDPDIVRKSQAARFDRVEDVDDVIALDLEWRKALQAAEKQRGAGGKIQKQIGEFKKKKEEPPAALMAEKAASDALKLELNSTLTACERTMCCLIENYQNLETGGLDIPEPLRPYLGGRDFLPFKFSIDKKGKLVKYDSKHNKK